MIEKHVVSRDENVYAMAPDLVLLPSGKLICVFAECTHNADRSYTRLVLTESTDRGRTWTPKRALTAPTHGVPFWNCPRIARLADGRLVASADKVFSADGQPWVDAGRNFLFFSEDDGRTWSDEVAIPADGIAPDKLLELESGRWIYTCHFDDQEHGSLVQRLWYSDDQGGPWSGPVIVGKQKGLALCEASILPVDDKLVAFMRENSRQGWDCFKAISPDQGETWSPVSRLPLPGCHRPVAGFLHDGRIMITHRFMQGGRDLFGWWTQNFFAALTDKESVLAESRDDCHTRILPVDFDRSPESDTGYSGWVQFDDGEIYIVNYIMDDAPKGQIRGYSLVPSDFLLPGQPDARSGAGQGA